MISSTSTALNRKSALAAAAVLLVHVDAEQPGRARLAPHLAVDQARLLPLGVVRDRLPGEELPAQVAELFVDRLVEVLLHPGASLTPGGRSQLYLGRLWENIGPQAADAVQMASPPWSMSAARL